MKNFIISSKGFLFFLLSGNIFIIFMFTISIIQTFNNIYFLLVAILILPFEFIFFIALNRLACIVYYNDKFLYRRGLIFDFRYKIEIKNIKKIVVATIPRQGRFIIIVDNEGNSYEGYSRKSFIRFTHNEDNIKFLRGFWNGNVEGL